MTPAPKARTPNEGDWCICGGVFGSRTGHCVVCGRPRATENLWVDPDPEPPPEGLTDAENASYEDGTWLGDA